MDVRVNIQGEKVEMLRFADDIVVLAEGKDELEMFLIEMDRVLKENNGMILNRNKSNGLWNKCDRISENET
jgi:hypothetical protein